MYILYGWSLSKTEKQNKTKQKITKVIPSGLVWRGREVWLVGGNKQTNIQTDRQISVFNNSLIYILLTMRERNHYIYI